MGEFDFLNENNTKSKTNGVKLNSAESKPNPTEINLNNINPSNHRFVKISSDEELEQVLAEIRNKANYDPLIDTELCKADHYIWKQVLKNAERQDNETYNLLHYLRCQQCKLKLDREKNTSHPIIKLDLDNSKYLLEQYITDDSNKQQYEQLQLVPTADNITKQRQENAWKAKRKAELEQEAKKRILEEVVLPKVKEVKLVFDMLKPLLRKAELKYSVYNFNLKAFNEYLEHKERGFV